MSESTTGLVVVAITRDEARVWSTGVEPGTKPESIEAPSEMLSHHHMREAQHHHGHEAEHDQRPFYESITGALGSASAIVLVGHGKGKADEMLKITQFWERQHPDVAQKVIGAIDSNLDALTENQILSLVRDWYDQYHEFI